MTGTLHGRYISTAQAAELLEVDVKTAERWCRSRKLRTKPGRKAGAPWKVVRSDVERLNRERMRR